jgi:Putative amidoligase enzyme
MIPNTHIGKWRSIEFELVFYSQEKMNQFENFIIKKKYDKYVSMQIDHSIRPNKDGYGSKCGHCFECLHYGGRFCLDKNKLIHIPKEVVVSYYKGKEQIVRDICKFLHKKAYVNKSCGTHVHFDMRHVDENEALLYGAKIGCCVKALKFILPTWRRNNQYCDKTINSFNEGNGDGHNRYAFVNMMAYKKYKTIEVRGHSGTLNAEKILNWIKICETIMYSKKNISVGNVKELIKNYKFSPKLSSFIKKRHKTLSKKSYSVAMEK